MKNLRAIALSLIVFGLTFSVFAQKTQTSQSDSLTPAKREVALQELKLKSKLMAREMPYRVLLPNNYEAEKTAKYPVLYLLHGLTGHFDNWTSMTKLREFAAAYNYIIVTPEGNDGWYTNSSSVPNDKYESYIVDELMPEVESKFRAFGDRDHRMIAGLSMGGYGSLKYGLKYPEKFVLVGSFSGALGAASWTDKTLGNSWKALTDSIMSVYGAEGSPVRAENDIYKMVREIPAEKVKALPFMYIDCGTEDFLIEQNRDFVAALMAKKIPHEFRQLPGAHDWKFWNSQVQEFLRVSQKFIK